MASKRFVYRMEKVLEMKRKKLDEEQEKLAKLRQQLEHERSVKAQLERTLEDVHVELKTKRLISGGAVNVAELRFFPQHIKNLENKIKYQELRIQELQIKIKEQELAVAKAYQEKQAYEKHREKTYEEWLAEIDAEEARMLDELATIKFSREQAVRVAEMELEQP